MTATGAASAGLGAPAAAFASSSSSPSTAALLAAAPSRAQYSTARPVSFAETRKRRKRASDHLLPERVEALIPQSALVSSLLSFERRLDADIARRYVAMQEAIAQPDRLQQTVRLFIWHEWMRLPTATSDAKWYWTLKVVCDWVDDADCSVGAGSAVGSPLRVLGSLLSCLLLQLDPALYPNDDGLVEWRKDSSPALTDGFELHRPAVDAACTVKLFLYPEYSPPLYTLSSALSRLLSLRQGSHVQVLRLLWSYCQSQSLLSASDPGVILPDDRLTAVLGSSGAVSLQQLNAAVEKEHLFAPEPVQLSHTIARPPSAAAAAAAASPSALSVFDITLPLPELPANAAMGSTLHSAFESIASQQPPASVALQPNSQQAAGQSPAGDAAAPAASSSSSAGASVPPPLSREWKELQSLTEAVGGQLSELRRIQRRRDFLQAFASAPTDCLHLLLSQQTRHVMSALTTQRADQAERRVRAEQQSRLLLSAAADAQQQQQQQSRSPSVPAAQLLLGGSRSVALLGGEEERGRRGRYYHADWMADAVDRYLEHRHSIKDSETQQTQPQP